MTIAILVSLVIGFAGGIAFWKHRSDLKAKAAAALIKSLQSKV